MTAAPRPSPTDLAPPGPQAGPAPAGRQAGIAPVRVATTGLAQDWRAVKIVWQRELIRFAQDRARAVSALVQPILFLFVLGTGLSSLTNAATGDVDLRTFMFPGVLATSTLFTAMFSAMSIVWDREFGFLREMLVAPVRRGSIMVGKALGGATVATLQAVLVLVLAPLVDVPLSLGLVATLLAQVFLLALMLTSLGLVVSARVKQLQAIMGVMQMLLLPLSFLSGALYPLRDLPRWLEVLTKLNPITYGVHAVRDATFSRLDATPEALAALNPPLTWWGWEVPLPVQLLVVVGVTVLLLGAAMAQFSRTD